MIRLSGFASECEIQEDVIDKALRAHVEWKRRLAQAIRDAGGQLTVEVVSADDRCEFGTWLHNEVAAEPALLYEKVNLLHRDFHLEAGRVLALAKAGQCDEAMQAIAPDSAFARLSGSLCYAQDQWRFKIRRNTQSDVPTVP